MTAAQALRVQNIVSKWTGSMIAREAIRIEGKMKGVNFACMGIVNRIEVESGSGLTYNVTTADGYVIFVNLA